MGTTLILIDRDDSARRALSRMLAAAGYEVVSLADVSELQSHPSPVGSVLLVVGGVETAKTARDELEGRCPPLSAIPVIVLANEGDRSERSRAHAIRAAAMLRKPVDGPALLDTIRWVSEAEGSGAPPG